MLRAQRAGGRTRPAAWWPDLGVIDSRRKEAHGVPVLGADPLCPVAELRAGPFEAVITVAHRLGGQGVEAHVVVDVRGADDDGRGCGTAEDAALESGQPRRVDVFDHLHQHDRVEAGQPVVAVGQRRLKDPEPGPLPLAHAVEPEEARGPLERSHRHVDGDDLVDGAVREQLGDQSALTAAEVADPRCP